MHFICLWVLCFICYLKGDEIRIIALDIKRGVIWNSFPKFGMCQVQVCVTGKVNPRFWKEHYVQTEPWNGAFLLFALPLGPGLNKYVRPWKLSNKVKCMRSYAPGMSGISCASRGVFSFLLLFFSSFTFFLLSFYFRMLWVVAMCGCMSLDYRAV